MVVISDFGISICNELSLLLGIGACRAECTSIEKHTLTVYGFDPNY